MGNDLALICGLTLTTQAESLLKSKLRKAEAEAELSRFEILPYTYKIAKTAAEIDATLTREGKSIGLSDIILAAIALLQTNTSNPRH